MATRLHSIFISTVCAFVLLMTANCAGPDQQERPFQLRIALTSEPDALNPVTYKTINGQTISNVLFQKLIDIDFHTLELTPVLAESRPTIQSLGDSIYSLTYHIRTEAVWDNGSPVSSDDVIFTHKVALLPGVANEGKKNYLLSIRQVNADPEDKRSVTFICTPGMRMEYATGAEIGILPQHIYDPNGLLTEIPIESIIRNDLDSLNLLRVKEWNDGFNQHSAQRSPELIQGSSPYQLTEWTPDQRIKLEKKANHWTTQVNSENEYFRQHPDVITYSIITEPTATIGAARNGQLDIGSVVRSPDYVSLQADDKFNEKFQLVRAPELTTNVIIINSCNPALASTKTRQALAHLFNAQQFIDVVQKSTGQTIIGPLHPSKKAYHPELEPYAFNPEKAKTLLAEDGWKDSNGNGVLDKMINGKLVELELEYKFNTGNEGRKNAGLMYKEWARSLGIDIRIVNAEWLVFIEQIMAHEFDLAFFSWTDEHAPTDLSPLYHSRAIDNGYNFGCYSNTRTDSLFDALATTIDEDVQMQLWHEIQEILHEEVPGIFLSTNEARFFVSRKYQEISPSAVAPGFYAPAIKPNQLH